MGSDFFNKNRLINLLVKIITAAAACSVAFILIGIVYILISESWKAIVQFSLYGFVSSTAWNPVSESFGALTSIYGTMLSTCLSLMMAIPIAIGIAIFITELAPSSTKTFIATAIELLAAIPSIIYGIWGFFTLSPIMTNYVEPFLQNLTGGIPYLENLFFGTPRGLDIFTASVILSIMIIPFTASIARDAFNLTPAVVKESAYALGSTKWEVIRHIVLPYSKLAVFGGVIVSLGRAIGETMAISFVLGNEHKIATSLLDSSTTITVTLANEFAEADQAIYLSSLFYLAFVLFVMSFFTLTISKFFFLKEKRS